MNKKDEVSEAVKAHNNMVRVLRACTTEQAMSRFVVEELERLSRSDNNNNKPDDNEDKYEF